MPNDIYFDLGRLGDLKQLLEKSEIFKYEHHADKYLSMLKGTKFRFVKDPQILA